MHQLRYLITGALTSAILDHYLPLFDRYVGLQTLRLPMLYPLEPVSSVNCIVCTKLVCVEGGDPLSDPALQNYSTRQQVTQLPGKSSTLTTAWPSVLRNSFAMVF